MLHNDYPGRGQHGLPAQPGGGPSHSREMEQIAVGTRDAHLQHGRSEQRCE